jgi:hypothetical protein
VFFFYLEKIGSCQVTPLSSPWRIKAGEVLTLAWHIEQSGKQMTTSPTRLSKNVSVVSAKPQHFLHSRGTLPGEHQAREGEEDAEPHEKFGLVTESQVFFPLGVVSAVCGQVMNDGRAMFLPFMVETRQNWSATFQLRTIAREPPHALAAG